MLTAVPLPDRPLRLLWQSTVVDLEPGSRYGHKNDAAAINTTLAVENDTDQPISFPLMLATTDPEQPRERVGVRIANDVPTMQDAELDSEWATLAEAITQASMAQGHSRERIQEYLDALRRRLRRAYKSMEMVTLQPRQTRFIRSHQRKRVSKNDAGEFTFSGIFPLPQFALATGGSISVMVAMPRTTQHFGVDLLNWTREFGGQAFGKDPNLPQVAGRYVASWFWQNDPELSVVYKYS